MKADRHRQSHKQLRCTPELHADGGVEGCTCGAGDDGAEAMLALDIIQHVQHAHAHPVLRAAVLVPLQLHQSMTSLSSVSDEA